LQLIFSIIRYVFVPQIKLFTVIKLDFVADMVIDELIESAHRLGLSGIEIPTSVIRQLTNPQRLFASIAGDK
jgi:hypothetical protein